MDNLPQVLPGFENIKRYYDQHRQMYVAKILPGEIYVTQNIEGISTVLGSCIAACIWDPDRGIGGMNHFMLPIKGDDVGAINWQQDNSYTCRYGLWAMEFLINNVIKFGGRRDRLKAKIFGGGKVLEGMSMDVGQKNIDFALQYLTNEGIEIVSKDVGGPWPRKILFFPDTAKVFVKKLYSTHNDTIERREKSYQHSLVKQQVSTTDVELFGADL